MNLLKTKNIIISLFIVQFFLLSAVFVQSFDSIDFEEDLLNGCWREEIDGVSVIYVSGSHYQMGYQYGYLLKDEKIGRAHV